jgi:hypothetical protein
MFDASLAAGSAPEVAPGSVVVALPVKDEETLIGACLRALFRQTRPADFVLLLLNNCRDGTRQALQAVLPGSTQLLVVETELSGPLACAGEARRLAMDLAAGLAPDGVLLTTDADAIVPPDWIEANLSLLNSGWEMVCGEARIQGDDLAGLSADVLRFLAHEANYLALLDEIAALIDPDPADPWPRHQQRSGATLSMRAAAYRLAGGVPRVACGEDRALVSAFRRIDARIRHAPDIIVPVSGRLRGRAAGGMADTLRRRMEIADQVADSRLEPLAERLRRLRLRKAARTLWLEGGDDTRLAQRLCLPVMQLRRALGLPYFGAAWSQVQEASPVLRRTPMAGEGLVPAINRAERVRDRLLAGAPMSRLQLEPHVG